MLIRNNIKNNKKITFENSKLYGYFNSMKMYLL